LAQGICKEIDKAGVLPARCRKLKSNYYVKALLFFRKEVTMGTIKKGILGGFSGTVGNVVGANWKGIDYMRIKPADVTNPNTDLQSTQRLKFAAVIRFLQPMTEYIRVGYKGYAVKMSAFNAAFSYNYHEALTGVYPNFEIDYPKALVSRGNLQGAHNPSIGSELAGSVSVAWTNNSGSSLANDSDVALVVLFNPLSSQAIYLLNAGMRADEHVDITVPSEFSGQTVHGYLTFMSIDAAINGQLRNSISTSSYAGSVVVA
jgi:hypothetical protein